MATTGRPGQALAKYRSGSAHFRGLPPCDLSHIQGFEPVLCSEHPNAIKRNNEDTTMTRLHGLSGLKAIIICAALSMSAGMALAGENIVPADQIINQLRPKPLTRGLSVGVPQVDPVVQAKETSF